MPDEIDPSTGKPVITQPAPFIIDQGGSPTPEQIRAAQAAANGAPIVPMTPTAPQPRWTDEDMERVRTEERTKLHSQLSKVDQVAAELEELRQARAADEAERQRVIDDAESAARAAEEDKMSTKALLERRTAEWESKFNELQTNLATNEAIFAKERRFSALLEYRANKLLAAEQQGTVIIPNLIDLIGGETEADIDASIATYAAKSAEIIDGIRQQSQQAWQSMPGVQATQPPTMGPLENQPGTRTFSEDDIKSMSMAEWNQHRVSLLRASGNAYRAGQR